MAESNNEDRPFDQSDKTFNRVYADLRNGLSDEQVLARKNAGATNKQVEPSTKTSNEIIKSNVYTYFNLIFFILAILLVIVRGWADLIFLPIIVINTGIGIWQEFHAKKTLDSLKLVNDGKYFVLRGGKKEELTSEKLVLDDIVIFKSGDQIPADAVIGEGAIRVNESAITGESNEVVKKPGMKIFSGSYVVSGKAIARLDQVGKDSKISQITLEAAEYKDEESSELIKSLDKIIKVVGIIILPVAVALFIQSFIYNKSSFEVSVKSMIAAIIGMIPEGLYLLASITMAISSARLAKRKVVIHDMKSIEGLARADVLCMDKTGTITAEGMKVVGYNTLGNTLTDRSKLFDILCEFIQNTTDVNGTMTALKQFFNVKPKMIPLERIAFSHNTKYSAITFGETKYVLGSAENILREDYNEYKREIENYAKKGYRILIFGKYEGEIIFDQELENRVEPLGIIFLANPIRKNAKETLAFFKENDIGIKVLSGDNPITVSNVAKRVGVPNADKCIDARELESSQDYKEAVENYTIFGRVTPNQKQEIVRALKSKKHSVAMIGDGVNDVLALKEADCSIAMAAKGTNAASQVSQLVLLESDFARLPLIVKEGRRVVNNLEKTATLYIVKNIFSFLLAVFSVICMLDYPLSPAQVSIISLFTIGIPSFVLALENNSKKLKGHFLKNILIKALPASLTDFLMVSSLVVFCREFKIDAVSTSTSCAILVAIIGFMILFQIAKPLTKQRALMLFGVILGWLICIVGFGKIFSITHVTRKSIMLTIIFAVAAEPILRYLTKFVTYMTTEFSLKDVAKTVINSLPGVRRFRQRVIDRDYTEEEEETPRTRENAETEERETPVGDATNTEKNRESNNETNENNESSNEEDSEENQE